MSARSPRLKPGWGPRLLLAGLVTILVFGACGTAQLLREDAARQPLLLRHHVQRTTILFTTKFDTLSTDFIYRGEVLLPTAAECPAPTAIGPGSGPRRLRVSQVRPLAGPEPRWLFELDCADGRTRSMYLLRLPAGGPEFHRVGPWPGWAWNTRKALLPLTDTLSYLADTDSSGALFDWQRFESTPVVLPRNGAVRWLRQSNEVVYSLSPNRRILARVCREVRPGAGVSPGLNPAQAAQSLVRLTIDSYDLDQRSPRRLVLDSLRLPPIALPKLIEWTQANGRWELLPRP